MDRKPPVRLLHVEDDIELGEMLKASLSSKGYSVVSCIDSQQARDALAKEAIDIVLTDVVGPDFPGLLDECRSRGIPYVILTGSNHEVDSRDAPRILQKPASLMSINEAIEEAMNLPNRTVIGKDDMRELMDPDNHTRSPLKKWVKLLCEGRLDRDDEPKASHFISGEAIRGMLDEAHRHGNFSRQDLESLMARHVEFVRKGKVREAFKDGRPVTLEDRDSVVTISRKKG